MKQVVEVLVKGIGIIGLSAAKALLADLAVAAKRHGFNQIAEGTSCEPGVINGDFVYEPAEGVEPPSLSPEIEAGLDEAQKVVEAKAKKANAARKARAARARDRASKAKGTAKKRRNER